MAEHNPPESGCETSSPLANRPRTRQRLHKAPPALEVPDINDDAAERKRVLNVLAQRRYRERKRHTRKSGPVVALEDVPRGGRDAKGNQGTSNRDANEQDGQASTQTQPGFPATAAAFGFPTIVGSNHTHSSAMSWDVDVLGVPSSPLLLDFSCLADDDPGASSTALAGVEDAPVQSTVDALAWLEAAPPLPSPAATTGGVDDDDLSFPDSYLLPVPELSTLKAFMRIATCLSVDSSIFWDIHAVSPFFRGGGAGAAATATSTSHLSLSRTWQPTAAQLFLPHHPLLDFLPWPSVREKVIRVLNLPEDMRPPAARSATALAQFAYDLEDGAEGIRIWGGDPYDPAGWEVGQVLFERWWFLFDRQVIEQSNGWRDMRGAARLRIAGAGGVRACGL